MGYTWYEQGLPHIWQPYSQMKTASLPLPVLRTYGTRIVLANGRELIDGIASWWTACHGYNHPHLLEQVRRQLEVMPHVMFGGLAHEPALTLARRLVGLLPQGLDRVFFSDSGSVAIEVALKMATQYWLNKGVRARTRFVAFKGGYHGDTTGAMALCDPDTGMHRIFSGLLPDHLILELPNTEETFLEMVHAIESHSDTLAGIVIEPLVQGAGGMRFHDVGVLQRVRDLANRYDLLLICDEIFTGFGRTGTMFASTAAGIVPDIVAISKALTGGVLPLAATIARRSIFDAFWSDDPKRALMHGPTYMANALACAAANASLDLFEQEPRLDQVASISNILHHRLQPCQRISAVREVRVLGAIGVVELKSPSDPQDLRRRFIEAGVWVRPFGSIVYLTPSFTIDADDLATLTDTIVNILQKG